MGVEVDVQVLLEPHSVVDDDEDILGEPVYLASKALFEKVGATSFRCAALTFDDVETDGVARMWRTGIGGEWGEWIALSYGSRVLMPGDTITLSDIAFSLGAA